MIIIADDKIPYLRGVLEPFAEVVYVPGDRITNNILKNADALLTRTRTRCNETLLKGTSVQFIGTATIGCDHIDTDWCEKQGIVWKSAPGCNASSVNQYIASALVTLSDRFGFSLKDRVLGVVGVGNVGTRVVRTGELLGMQVYLCDPPRVRNESSCGFISLEGILRECDIITFHVPLNRSGMDRTYHIIDNELLTRVNPGTILINTSRGEVANGNSLKDAMHQSRLGGLVLDVWENEPEIDPELMNLCTLATPHIAGYSADGKARGTAMVIRELSRHFNLEMDDWETNDIPEPGNPEIRINGQGLTLEEIVSRAVLHTYRVTEDDKRLREKASDFEKQRGNYPLRREFNAYNLVIEHADPEIKKICRKLGFNIQE
ncbi:MAG: 4-phosphoerythronate dehydrogenase PdxB [Bacteroidales bacterium]|nr:4-phosphoerythronate dehydrogenase PdxB [Bacteroidales bacterium]